jgi:hypothetical protein
MTFYLIYADGSPALALTFASADDANAACERYFGAAAVNTTVLVAAFGDDEDEAESPSREQWLALAGGAS